MLDRVCLRIKKFVSGRKKMSVVSSIPLPSATAKKMNGIMKVPFWFILF